MRFMKILVRLVQQKNMTFMFEDGDSFTFSDVKQVKRSWEVVGELGSISRSDEDTPEEDFIVIEIKIPERSMWGDVLNFSKLL